MYFVSVPVSSYGRISWLNGSEAETKKCACSSFLSPRVPSLRCKEDLIGFVRTVHIKKHCFPIFPAQTSVLRILMSEACTRLHFT